MCGAGLMGAKDLLKNLVPKKGLGSVTQNHGRCAGPNRWLVETIFHRDVIRREISRVLVLTSLTKNAVLGTTRRSSSLTMPSLLSRAFPNADRVSFYVDLLKPNL
jgi:hypothetical protein